MWLHVVSEQLGPGVIVVPAAVGVPEDALVANGVTFSEDTLLGSEPAEDSREVSREMRYKSCSYEYNCCGVREMGRDILNQGRGLLNRILKR